MTRNAFVYLAFACLATASTAPAQVLNYEVRFKGAIVATQTVTVARNGSDTTVHAAFSADLHVFVAVHHYEEALSVTFRPDGTITEMRARISDGPRQVEIEGRAGALDVLQVVRRDPDGVSSNYIPRAEYDFPSLMMYGTDPATFLPDRASVRVFSEADGRVLPVTLQTISESKTFERQYLKSLHLIWTEGSFISHSWHPERFSNLPDCYIRQSEAGEFTFTLLR